VDLKPIDHIGLSLLNGLGAMVRHVSVRILKLLIAEWI